MLGQQQDAETGTDPSTPALVRQWCAFEADNERSWYVREAMQCNALFETRAALMQVGQCARTARRSSTFLCLL